MPLSFDGNPNFVNTSPLYTFNIQFMYDNLNFSFLLWNKLYLYFVTFLLRVSIDMTCCQLKHRLWELSRSDVHVYPWVWDCQSVGTVNFALPFTTNVTISISILQTFRTWVITFHLRPPMAFLSNNSSNTSEFASLMNVWFWGQCDCPISLPHRDMSRNVWNRPQGKSMVDTGISLNNMRTLSP